MMELTDKRKEITNAMIENARECKTCTSCNMLTFGSEGNCIRALATALKAERAKPKVWDSAPDKATRATVEFYSPNEFHNRFMSQTIYTRELPKTRAREIAEQTFNAFENIVACESAILKAQAEWEAGR